MIVYVLIILRIMVSSGGVMEEDDYHEIETALRETEEEIGISSEFIDVWGAGSQITPSFDTSVVPVIAEIRNFHPSMLKANPEEVDEIFTISLKRLINPKYVRHTQFRTSSGGGYVMPCYLGGPKKFWGMTAVVSHTRVNRNVRLF
jgi:nudix motif 8